MTKRLIVLASLAAATLLGSSVDYTYTTTVQSLPQSCVSYAGPCQAYDLTIPQFDPNLGTLDSITWTFTDSQGYYGGIDVSSFAVPLPEPYSYIATEGDTSSVLGLNVSATQTVSGMVYGYVSIERNGIWRSDTLQASGTVADDSSFIGTGTVDIAVTPFISATGGGPGVSAALTEVSDYATLTVTYHETPTAVPEPRQLFMGVMLIIVAAAAGRSGVYSRFSRGVISLPGEESL